MREFERLKPIQVRIGQCIARAARSKPRSDLNNRQESHFQKVARASCSPAPGITATVAPFRAWRNSRLTVAGKPTRTGGDYPRFGSMTQRLRSGLTVWPVGM